MAAAQVRIITVIEAVHLTPASLNCYCMVCQVEQYVCSRISRNPSARLSGAKYLGEFTAEQSIAGFTKGARCTHQWCSATLLQAPASI